MNPSAELYIVMVSLLISKAMGTRSLCCNFCCNHDILFTNTAFPVDTIVITMVFLTKTDCDSLVAAAMFRSKPHSDCDGIPYNVNCYPSDSNNFTSKATDYDCDGVTDPVDSQSADPGVLCILYSKPRNGWDYCYVLG